MRQKTKTAKSPVMLGTLPDGARFIYQGSEWKVLQQNWSDRERKPDEGKAKCQKINTPVIINLCRGDYVQKV